MSFYTVGAKQYQNTPAGAPGWQLAPVPGWGMNPERAGAPILAMEGLGANDSDEQANQGYIAMALAGGIVLGWFFGWFYFTQVKK